MEQKRPVLITSEETSKLPILIVDKKGFVGCALAEVLREQFLVVVVTAHDLERHNNIIHVPYHKKVPMIPDNTYSHLFVVYNGETELLDMLQAFEEKAEAIKARFLFITSLLYSSPKLFNRLRHPGYAQLQTVLFGETFDNAITEANEINFFIHQARVYGRIEVPKEGLGMLYPIFFDDMLTSIITIAFAVEKPKEIIYLFPHHIYNEITVARIIQKIEPLIKVDFSKRKSTSRMFLIPPNGLYYFRDYNLEERLRKIDFSRVGHRSKLPQKKIKLKVSTPEEKQSRMKLLFVSLIAIFIAPIIITSLCFLFGAGLLIFSIRQVESGSFSLAQTSASIAQISFSAAEMFSPSLFLPQLLLPEQKRHFIDMVQIGKIIASSEISFVQAVQITRDIYAGNRLEPKTDFLHAQVTVKNTLLTMQKMEAQNDLPQYILQKLHYFEGTINLVEETIDTWPKLLGFEGKKTYLLLFQNNMELQPGGGFIGSYGILSIENGRLGKLKINDVYDADGHLTEHIQPPFGLQRYLGVSHLFLRDSNFNPDFTIDAKQAAFFLQKETGQKVNGVISIDTTFLKNLLSVVGSVDVPDYKVTVTPDNFYILTETHVEKNFFPGSTQKKDFLRSLTNALIDKLSSKKQLPYEKIAQMLVMSVQQKDILFAFSDLDVQNVFTVNGLSSSLWDGRKFEQSTAFDYFGVVDANLGGNKANYYIKRSINQATNIEGTGGLQSTATVTYMNTSTKVSAFGGEYKDYVRFLIPANASFGSVTIDNKQIQTTPAITDPAAFTSPNFIPPPSLEVEQTEEEGKKIIGFFIIVPVGITRTVSITYTEPGVTDSNTIVNNYSLHLFKQPGAGNDHYQLSLAFPNDFTVVSNDAGFTNVGGKLIYDGQLTADKTITANFSKK